MIEKDYELLSLLFQKTDVELKANLAVLLDKRYSNVKNTKKYLYAEGSLPVMLVAHLDTVFTHPPEEIFYDAPKGVMWSPQGLGADDRAGVFAILKLIEAGFRPHILFTMDEEMGGLGANAFVNENPTPPKNLKFIIELDRRGDTDCVFYRCGNKDFHKFIESYNFITKIGSFSDISTICPKWNIAGVNLSVGYQNEHEHIEFLKINSLFSTIKKTKEILQYVKKNLKMKKFDFQENGYLYGSYYQFAQAFCSCQECGRPLYGYDGVEYVTKNGKFVEFCDECFSMTKAENTNWCEKCYYPFESDNKEDKICYRCKN